MQTIYKQRNFGYNVIEENSKKKVPDAETIEVIHEPESGSGAVFTDSTGDGKEK